MFASAEEILQVSLTTEEARAAPMGQQVAEQLIQGARSGTTLLAENPMLGVLEF